MNLRSECNFSISAAQKALLLPYAAVIERNSRGLKYAGSDRELGTHSRGRRLRVIDPELAQRWHARTQAKGQGVLPRRIQPPDVVGHTGNKFAS